MNRKPISVDFEMLLETVSRQIYDTPMAFLRENVQNAVDAHRMSRAVYGEDPEGAINIGVEGAFVEIRDCGIGMTEEELDSFFWRMGASGKNTELGRRAGCIGTFGIGGFANFGVCSSLEVVSKKRGSPGVATVLRKEEFRPGELPEVCYSASEEAGPQGTIVRGRLLEEADAPALRDYLLRFVRFVPEKVIYNDELVSGRPFVAEDAPEGLERVSSDVESVSLGDGMEVRVQFYKDRVPALTVILTEGLKEGESFACRGVLRLVSGPLEVFKNAFKLCNTSVQTAIGISGRIDCELFSPTAGRDSLTGDAQRLVSRLCSGIEERAIAHVLESSDLLAQHTRVMRFVLSHGLVEKLDLMAVTLGDGSEATLGGLRLEHEGGTSVYFGRQAQKDLLEVLHAGGNRVVILSGDSERQRAERKYLERYCSASPYEGLVQVRERYTALDTFELSFLSDMEYAIQARYDVRDAVIEAGAITGGVPAFVPEPRASSLRIVVDVRHAEVRKLRGLEGSTLLYSMAAEFCKAYLGGTLKSRSPKFFGSGALDFDEMVRRRAEVWDLGVEEIHTEVRGEKGGGPRYGGSGLPQVMDARDVGEVSVGAAEDSPEFEKKILRILDRGGAGVGGYYLRLMDRPAEAFGSEIQAMDEAVVYWFGNRITFAFSDGADTAFHYEVRLRELVRVVGSTEGGMAAFDRPIQEIRGGLFVPIPEMLEEFLVPEGDREISVRVNYEWFDLRRGRKWMMSRRRKEGAVAGEDGCSPG
jgi:molecular chaperone HtpG